MACEVHTADGKKCGMPVVKRVVHNGKVLHLCDRCFQNILLGAYGHQLAVSARRALKN